MSVNFCKGEGESLAQPFQIFNIDLRKQSSFYRVDYLKTSESRQLCNSFPAGKLKPSPLLYQDTPHSLQTSLSIKHQPVDEIRNKEIYQPSCPGPSLT